MGSIRDYDSLVKERPVVPGTHLLFRPSGGIRRLPLVFDRRERLLPADRLG
jgi:hypothetical protein